MMELPEAVVIAKQVTDTLTGKRVAHAVAAQSPHKFAWYTGDPANYNNLLAGKTVRGAVGKMAMVETRLDEMLLVIGAAMHYHRPGEKRPARHQLLVEFEDASALSVTIQMWGGIFCFKQGEKGGFPDYDNAQECPSLLSDAFDRAYFNSLFTGEWAKMSSKEFLATKQRIPGLGNGALQDILWTARIHPKRKMATLSDQDLDAMYAALKSVVKCMTDQGGRDTERDLYGNFGGYKTVLSKNTVGTKCPECGTIIAKEAFLGGSIY